MERMLAERFEMVTDETKALYQVLKGGAR